MRKSKRPDYIYFEPRTGNVRFDPLRTNFYVFRLKSEHLTKVELVVSKAFFGPHGYEYDVEFLKWLYDNDTGWDQLTGLPVPTMESPAFPSHPRFL